MIELADQPSELRVLAVALAGFALATVLAAASKGPKREPTASSATRRTATPKRKLCMWDRGATAASVLRRLCHRESKALRPIDRLSAQTTFLSESSLDNFIVKSLSVSVTSLIPDEQLTTWTGRCSRKRVVGKMMEEIAGGTAAAHRLR